MSTDILVALVGGAAVAINAISLVIVAVIQTHASARNHIEIKAVKETVIAVKDAVIDVKQTVAAATDHIEKIEVATNSMKDALVKATADEALARGRELGLAEGKATAATLVEGALLAQPPTKPAD